MRFFVSFSMKLGVLFRVFGRCLRSQGLFMHFLGDGVGFRGGVLVIRLVIFFAIVFLITFVVFFVVQRFLQLFELGGLHVRFRNRFDGLGTLFGIGLRFFVLGFGKLFRERVYVFLGKARTILGLRPARDFRFGRRRRNGVLLRGRVRLDLRFSKGNFVLLRSRGRRSCEERSGQSRGQFLVRERARRRQRGGSSAGRRSTPSRRRR